MKAIHENETIAEIDKFTYLKSFLSNSALSAISGLSVISANYKEAIDTLRKHSSLNKCTRDKIC